MPQQTDPRVLIGTVRAFSNVIDNVFTTYFDGRGGFLEQCRRLSPIMAQSAASLGVSLDDLPLIYGDSDPSAPKAKELVRSTQQAFLDRNKERGENHVFLANVCLVAIYQYWEDHYRKQIAEACGVPKGQIKVPIMGELRQIRRSIIHNKTRALPEVETCTHFDFQADEPIEIDHTKMQELLLLIREDLVVSGRRTVALSGHPLSRTVLKLSRVRFAYSGGERGEAVDAGAGVRGGARG